MKLRQISAPIRSLAIVLLVIGLADPAYAHDAKNLAGGAVAGFKHPLSGFDHLLAMVAVGIWGAFLGRPLIYLLPIVFPTVMAFGAVLGMSGVPFPPIEIGIALSVLTLGGAIAFGWRAPIWLAMTIVAVFGLFHGFAHGQELPSMADPVAFSLGFVVATGMLHVAGIGIGMVHALSGGVLFTRIMGGIIACAGLWFLISATVG